MSDTPRLKSWDSKESCGFDSHPPALNMKSMRCALACVVVAIAGAQAQAPQRFEVASVKASPPLPPGGARVVAGTVVGGQWISQNAPLIDILRAVYPDYRLRGLIVAPDWVQRTRFDIDARTVGELRVRTEPREIEVRALTIARADGRLGGALRSSSVDCEAVAAARAKGESPEGPGGLPLWIALSDERWGTTLCLWMIGCRDGTRPFTRKARTNLC